MPSLQVARSAHSSCVLGNSLYTFGGGDQEYNELNSVEWIELKEAHDEQLNQEWQLIEFDPTTLPPRSNPVFCPLNETEILIAGGDYYDEEIKRIQRNDVLVFNTEDRSVTTLVQDSQNDFKF